MNFHINKHATQPILFMELIDDGRNDYKKFHEKIQNADITFTMTDVITGVKKIACRNATLVLKEIPNCDVEEYYITYQFREKDTNIPGTYIGQFNITFLDGSGILKAPIREELIINVIEGSIKK